MIVGILQARVSSTRLPGKVLKPILGRPMLAHQIDRMRKSKRVDRWILATSTSSEDEALSQLSHELKIDCYRGSLNDVLDRFYRASENTGATHLVRTTGDCPLFDPDLLDQGIDFYLSGQFDYLSNFEPPTFPDGLDFEIFKSGALEKAWKEAVLPSEREHVTPYLRNHPETFRKGNFQNPWGNWEKERWTVDEPADFELVSSIYEGLLASKPDFRTLDIVKWLNAHPELVELNRKILRNEGYLKSLDAEKKMTPENKSKYTKSEQLLERALKSIPLGSQTFSKSRTQYPHGVSPFFIQKGKGSKVWDVDGNEYTDWISSLCSITLGYSDPDVDQAVIRQLKDGVIFSLPHPIEMEVAERIIEMVPCAEKVRFGKNGSDATSGAIRVARAFTGKDRVAVCGYHGWQDWYIGSTARNRGVPEAVRELTHPFRYNDLPSLEETLIRHKGEFAAVILEPMNSTFPAAGFLEGAKKLAHEHGALLVFDETITGFRFANGGAQEYFGVTPDLATFGKGLANGYPVSAVCGRADVMKLMEEVFFSFTFGGEALSLAAAAATLDKLKKEPVVQSLWKYGNSLFEGLSQLVNEPSLSDLFGTAGCGVWSFLTVKDFAPYTQWQIKSLLMQEMFSRGMLTIGSHNLNYCHRQEEVDSLLSVYREVLPWVAEAVKTQTLEKKLRCEPIQPLFKIR